MFSGEDLEQIRIKGVSVKEVEAQLLRFKKGFNSTELFSSATIGDGIIKLSEDEINEFISLYDESNLEVVKFVPASGAATRMFKPLYSFLESFDGSKQSLDEVFSTNKKARKFFENLSSFAFYNELEALIKDQEGEALTYVIEKLGHKEVLKALLEKEGMDYGALPKGLLKFHKYPNETRTPAQEHLEEGDAYANGKNGVNIHFTVSQSHQERFGRHVSENTASRQNVNVTFSHQHESTDTIASTEDFLPFRDEKDKLLFRPAGHGALLQNLNKLQADIIFVKNIDNVVPDRLREETIKYKKALAGMLLEFQQRVFDLLKRADCGEIINEEAKQLLAEMGLRGNIADEDIPELLNRPIRVCGMVKNEGEPGGGPFWVKDKNGKSLQIIESAQVDKSKQAQKEIFESGTHFNPVDLVLGVKNYKGEKFDLLPFQDKEAGFISEKTYAGKKLLAMELPGLWNGGMASWNTVFVEVPLVTFNPVKTVTDLLKEAHR